MLDNLTAEELKARAISEGSRLLGSGALVSNTEPHTGRSANAKFYVIDEVTKEKIDWENNKSISPELFKLELVSFLKRKEDTTRPVYRTVAQAVRDDRRSMNVEFFTEKAVHTLFVKNMFVEAANLNKDTNFSVYHFPSISDAPKVLVSLKDKVALISGTLYSGEIKKTIFSVLNYYFPDQGELPMHCSANMSLDKDNVAIFFGLSGTGKTTLSSDVNRILIGDDEHCWTKDGVTNFEGGCYAKTFKLSAEDEPQIWSACHGDLTLLENVVDDGETVDFADGRISENARASYPFHYISNASEQGFIDKHPTNIIMLTCDAFGVLPPVSKLTADEAYKHFLLGYTAKVAGTEVGIKAPVATFSSCFGAPFMPRHPKVYAALLKEKVKQHKTNCWLVNTGWTGGPYGVGERISISTTRKIIDGILSGELSQAPVTKHKYTDLTVPMSQHIENKILLPEMSWANLEDYKIAVSKLNKLFLEQEVKILLTERSGSDIL